MVIWLIGRLWVISLEQVYKDSTWGNTSQTLGDWELILSQGTEEERFTLYEYLFRETPHDTALVTLFTEEERARFIVRLDKPYYRAHTERRRLLWRAILLGEPVDIPGLRWNI